MERRFAGWYGSCFGVAAMKSNKLLQVLVVFGASLTGGVESVACGGSVDAGATRDAAADSKAGYGRISIDAAYGKISVDGGGDYGRIMPASLDAGDSGTFDGGDPSDANEAG